MLISPIDRLAFDAAVVGGIIGCIALIVLLATCIIAACKRRTSSGTAAAWLILCWLIYCALYGTVAMTYVIIRHMGV